MATEVKLPDLGEGIEDATISRWLVKVGDEVSAGDILLEVATDKVDTEVPAPTSGKVLQINHGEGSLVDLNTVIAVLGAEGESVASDSSGGAEESKPKAKAETKEIPAPDYGTADYRAPDADAAEEDDALPDDTNEATPQVATPSENGHGVKASPVAKRVAADKGVRLDGVSGTGPGGRITKGDVLATADGSQNAGVAALPDAVADVAPMSVLRLVVEYNLNINEIAGDRPLSTLTRYDVLSALASRGAPVAAEPRFIAPVAVPGAEKAAPAETGKAASAEKTPATNEGKAPAKAQPKEVAAPAKAGADEELIKHTRMRQAIARNTVQSWTTVPHVTTVWDVDMSAVINHRKAHKNEFAAAGVNLTITAYFFEAIVAGLKAVPAANASYSDEGTLIKRNYNIGMAVALPQDENGLGGLIVPVIKNAGDLNLMGIARAVNDLADKARKNQLKADELADGTFTLTNYGTSGSRMQTPLIIQPQAGILGVGAVEKRAVVISKGSPLEASLGDSLAFLPMTTLSLSYDHRVLDGATADAFCAVVKKALESYQ
jgi:pyruvate/2-oxoglutarate dehydrogenase complex dihydrolipoamide acyltransferase (E2) component